VSTANSLSITCRALFSSRAYRAPHSESYVLVFVLWYVELYQHPSTLGGRFLLRAQSIGVVRKNNLWADQPQRITDSLSVSAASFRHILSILSGPSSLHTLSLTMLRVEPAHQVLILSIKTLRYLKLVNSSFVPTSMVMPRSFITALWLEGHYVPTKHLLTLLRSSLETLRFSAIRVEVYDVLARYPASLV
jgi:hypothetical protein